MQVSSFWALVSCFLRSSSGQAMEPGEKYACAELMVDEIKSAGGIMPKVSQTLAMKPDVVKEGGPRDHWGWGYAGCIGPLNDGER